jgi:hypothetical protein
LPVAHSPESLRKKLAMLNRKLIPVIIFVSIPYPAQALESLMLQAGSLNATNWKLEGITIALTDLMSNPQKLTLRITKLELPKPFNDLDLVDIHCSSFIWKNKELVCQHGKAKIRSKQWLSPEANFSFHFRENHNSIKLTDLQLLGSDFAIDAEKVGQQWALQVNAKNVQSQLIHKLVPTESIQLKEGSLNFRLNAAGSHAQITRLTLDTELNKLTGQTPSGQFATEKLVIDSHVEARHQNNLWLWQIKSQIKGGALYAEPVYLEAGKPEINLTAQGNWDSLNHRIEIISANYQQSLTAEVNGNATIQFNNGVHVEKAAISLQSKDLQTFTDIYLQPFFTQTALEGIKLAGDLKADFSLVQQTLNGLTASFNKLDINDATGRIKMQGGKGTINWANDETFNTPSQLSWQQLNFRSVPIGPSQLPFLSKAKAISLLKKATLPFLGGSIDINRFSWQAKAQDEPDVSFEGNLHNASLAQLSTALNWTPLAGTISGVIPRVNYHNKTLNLDGQLKINVFDGNVTISNLSSSGLFTGFPKLHADMEIDNLNLEQLTGKFSFGSITGKLSGFVRQLYLENWKPVTFYAWLGTPDNDDTSHRISQKAVNNIASIGGGGASDLISKSFLGLFETFGYDKLGLGCYLYQGVCQLMGVNATSTGYAIITGGGLPRIDVIGYNPRVDWNVLIERLGRITASDKVIVK